MNNLGESFGVRHPPTREVPRAATTLCQSGDDIGGIAVHIGARVAGQARRGEVLVSSTVRDLVAGSGLEFEDRGDRVLKGLPGAWRVFAAVPQ